MVEVVLILPAMLLWLAVLLLPWQPWRAREQFDVTRPSATATAADNLELMTVVIPARNEAAVIGHTLHGLAAQSPVLEIIIVDDQSTDNTAAVAHECARSLGLTRLQIINTPPLPAGWSGKLWALEQARALVKTPCILLLDADISLRPGVLGALLRKLHDEDLHLLSLMARLRMESHWEKLLMPAFIYFFKLLYPFALSNRPGNRIAAAAGGCILLRTATLDRIGGFAAVRGALIDDCSLAGKFKADGHRIWTGLTHDVTSLRRYDDLTTIWQMVTRTAYAQLRYSPLILLLCLLMLGVMFITPVAGLGLGAPACFIALTSLLLMLASYVPTLHYYQLPLWRALSLPLAAILFACMTADSARQHLSGHGNIWKGRAYSHGTGQPGTD